MSEWVPSSVILIFWNGRGTVKILKAYRGGRYMWWNGNGDIWLLKGNTERKWGNRALKMPWENYLYKFSLHMTYLSKTVGLILGCHNIYATIIFWFPMATHSSVLAWRIPGTGEPGGLLFMGSHRVGHNWSDLAAAAVHIKVRSIMYSSIMSKKRMYIP